jgi:hypothetical protein
MEMSEASTLNFRHLQVVQLCDRAKVGLADAALFGEKPPDELDGVVPEPRGVRVPENGAAIVEALLAQWAAEDAVVLDVTSCTRSGMTMYAHRRLRPTVRDATPVSSDRMDDSE